MVEALNRFAEWFARKGAVGGIARSQYSIYKRIKKKTPDLKESDIAQWILAHRIHRLGPGKKEIQRLEDYFARGNPYPDTLRRTCYIIAQIEFNINPHDWEHDIIVKDIINKELDRIGYIEEKG